jgi:hypothetical protein
MALARGVELFFVVFAGPPTSFYGTSKPDHARREHNLKHPPPFSLSWVLHVASLPSQAITSSTPRPNIAPTQDMHKIELKKKVLKK